MKSKPRGHYICLKCGFDHGDGGAIFIPGSKDSIKQKWICYKSVGGCDEIAVKWLPHPSPWISVDERLPKRNQEVLWIADVMTGMHEHYSRRIFAGRYQGNEQGLAEFSFPGFQCTGTHWMALPDLPEGMEK